MHLVERKTDGDWYPMALLPTDTTSHSDTDPKTGEKNYYRVFAIGPSGEHSERALPSPSRTTKMCKSSIGNGEYHTEEALSSSDHRQVNGLGGGLAPGIAAGLTAAPRTSTAVVLFTRTPGRLCAVSPGVA